MKKLISLFIFLFIISYGYTTTFASSIVNVNQVYTYEIMTNDIERLKERYPHLVTYHSIGKTYFGRDIWAVKIGHGKGNVFINGSHHAREWISTSITMQMMEYYLDGYANNRIIDGYATRDVLNEMSIWFVPMLNPDGVTLQQTGLKEFPTKYHNGLISMNGNSRDFTRWKANARGIDPNRQYPANWHSSSIPNSPSWAGYKGTSPFQTEENKAIRDLIYKIQPEMAISYHSSGRVLFWHFHNKKENYNRDYRLAKALSEKTKYTLVNPTANPSGKGYTDWFIQEFGKPAFTPELGSYVGDRHVPLSMFPEEWSRNHSVGLWAAAEGYDLKYKTKPTRNFDEKIRLTDKTFLYSNTSLTKKTSNALNPQVVNAVEYYNNWYKIETYLGLRWVLIENKLANFPERTYLDVPKGFWAKTEIDFMKELAWLTGTDAENYSPNSPVTRAQMATILTRILNIDTDNVDSSGFIDVPKDHWAINSIDAMQQMGIFEGFDDGTFRPNVPISRAQIASVLIRLSNIELMDVSERPFPDVPTDHWAAKNIQLMKDLNIFKGRSDGSFGLNSNTTRSEIAVILARIQHEHPQFFQPIEIPVAEEESNDTTTNENEEKTIEVETEEESELDNVEKEIEAEPLNENNI